MNNESFYGNIRPNAAPDILAIHAEELATLGYTILENVIEANRLQDWRDRIDHVYARQEEEFGGRAALSAIGEQDLARAPLLHDSTFLELATQPRVLDLMRRILGDYFILNLQNAIINKPEERHHQTAWHRDLPYQNWTSSRPLALGALFAIDPFNPETGGTIVLPHSHRVESMPSAHYFENHAVQVSAAPGSVLIFDAMAFHRAGVNRSAQTRRGVNHLYTIPIMKQQYDFPAALGADFQATADVRRLLGFDSAVPQSVLDWRRIRAKRTSSNAK
ncbi:phytanoyl-CoA dioxygenase family protein [Cupriavidus pauculus]|uniref:Phytanoyl-CoA dioxygenase family protein n=1 Tax=Cupriavidus pauculus TaxID=82633 RepID=A0A2N5CH09_9BURK|nr:phytanoyl-CoA dioxygenase family protein [Cupriavidus pauculus]PLQ01530.1 phytanoyl-CoA dioxygenase family protein [Cupriavidus pauculus]